MKDFRPISSYGFIGNQGSCALVNQNGSIDWCCLPRLDSPSVFASILDPRKGGSFSIEILDHPAEVTQLYVPDTPILITTFKTSAGTLEVHDWMHMGPWSEKEEVWHRIPAIYRSLHVVSGEVHARIHFDPKLDYARGVTKLSKYEQGIRAEHPTDSLLLQTDLPFVISEEGAVAECSMKAWERTTLICSYGSTDVPNAEESLEQTKKYWHTWMAKAEKTSVDVLGEWYPIVARSAITLKILAGGDGIAAAATTSLPEFPGSYHNWDYRFNWMRDTSFTLQAFTVLGYTDDAREFLEWLTELLSEEGRRPADLKVLYPLYGTTLHPEEELEHLRGYLDSKPVRIGNAASEQQQNDIYGEILDCVFRFERLKPGIDERLRNVLIGIIEYVCDIWRNPDHGIWELRQEPKHYVYSKVMCWVALDRGIKLAEKHAWNADIARWKEERAAIVEDVMTNGFSQKRNAFMQAYGDDQLDATALLFPILEFIPGDHPYVIGTLEATQKVLTDGALVYLSERHKKKEGTFGLCSFWLVDALVFAGRLDEARENLLKLMSYANHVGLYAEQIDADGTFLGNFPQAFTHVGLMNSALYLAQAEGAKASPIELLGEENLV